MRIGCHSFTVIFSTRACHIGCGSRMLKFLFEDCTLWLSSILAAMLCVGIVVKKASVHKFEPPRTPGPSKSASIRQASCLYGQSPPILSPCPSKISYPRRRRGVVFFGGSRLHRLYCRGPAKSVNSIRANPSAENPNCDAASRCLAAGTGTGL